MAIATVALTALKYLGPIAYDFAEGRVKGFVQGKVEQEVMKAVFTRVYAELDLFIQGIVHRTKIYIGLTSVALLTVLASSTLNTAPWINWFGFLFILAVIFLMAFQFIRTLTKAMDFISNYEAIIKKDIEEEFKKVKTESWQKKATLWYTGANSENYFHFVLSQILEAFCKWLTDNKKQIYLRIACYTLTVFTLSYFWRSIALGY